MTEKKKERYADKKDKGKRKETKQSAKKVKGKDVEESTLK